jgi:hypothetical protein
MVIKMSIPTVQELRPAHQIHNTPMGTASRIARIMRERPDNTAWSFPMRIDIAQLIEPLFKERGWVTSIQILEGRADPILHISWPE